MEIKSLSLGVNLVEKTGKNNEFFADLGEVKKGKSKTFIVGYSSPSKIENPFATASCTSCTRAQVNEIEENSFKVQITFSGKALGGFNKYVLVYLKTRGVKQMYRINFSGNVVR